MNYLKSFLLKRSDRLRQNIDFLSVLAKCNKKQRIALLEHCDKELILTLSEIAVNVLKGVVKLTPSQRAKLNRFKKHLRTLATRQVSIKHKRDFLVQKGGSLLLSLLPPVLTFLGETIFRKK